MTSPFSAAQSVARYARHAATYDRDTAQFNDFRDEAVQALDLQPGQTVVDVGCGTGLCLPAIQRAIGPSGTAIALEPCPQMLAQAMCRAGEHGWSNVVPINATAEEAGLPGPVDAVLFCATHDVLRSRRALAAVFAHLRRGGRWVATGGKWVLPWASPLNVVVAGLHAPYVRSFEGFDRPWSHLSAYSRDLHVRSLAWGTGYLATGTHTPATDPESRYEEDDRG